MRKTKLTIFFVMIFFGFFSTTTSVSAIQNFSHIKTGGFDYPNNAALASATEQQWLATHHDMIVGFQGQQALGVMSGNKLSESVYDTMKSANPSVKLVQYIPYNTTLPFMKSWMETWAASNGRNIEDLYYHYYYDTQVRLRNSTIVTFPGYGGGTATSLAQARVPSAWWSGAYHNINPTSQTFRDAFNAMALEMVTVNISQNKYADGVFLDTFDGTVDDYYDPHLENTIEMRDLGITTATAARIRAKEDLLQHRDEMEAYLTQHTGRQSTAIPNAAETDYVFSSRADMYSNRYSSSYNEMGIEYLVTSIYTSTLRIPRLKQLYDSMDAGITYFNNSQTNYTANIPFNFTQFILATHYIINHSNGYFSYHLGSASHYGPASNGSFSATHWHKNIEYDIGSPTIRQGQDYWGQTNTNRFFIFADGGSTYKIVGREYENALVLAKFGNVGGWTNIGINQTMHQLGGNYKRLLEDNTLGPVITEISLGFAEGAILIKEIPTLPDTTPPSAPQGLVVN